MNSLLQLYFKFRYALFALVIFLGTLFLIFTNFPHFILAPLQNLQNTWSEYQKVQQIGQDSLIQNRLSTDIYTLKQLKIKALQSQTQNLEASGLLNNIIQVAQSHQLIVYEFHTPPIQTEGNTIKTPIELHFKGQMPHFLQFMQDIENRALIVGTERIEIESSPTSKGTDLKIHVLLNAISTQKSLELTPPPLPNKPTSNNNPFQKNIPKPQVRPIAHLPKPLPKSSTQAPSSQSVPKIPAPSIQINSISWGQNPVVILSDHGNTRICKKGDAIQNWTIVEIQKNALILEQNGQRVNVSSP